MGSIVISILLTAATYMAFPLIRLALNHGKFEEKQAKKIALWNSIVLGLLFCILTSAVTDSSSAWSVAPAALYYWINCALLTDKAGNQKNSSAKKGSSASQAAPHDLGTEQQAVYCRKCGCKLSSDSNFCSKCGTEVYAEKTAPTSSAIPSVDAEKQHSASTSNRTSPRSDPWEISRPAPKKNTAKIVCACAFILLVATVGIILFNNFNEEDTYYYDSTDTGDAPSADSVNPNDRKSYDVKKIRISADSSAGVGDVFSQKIAHEDYCIYNNQIGQTYTVNYKIIGGVGQTELTLVGDTLLPVYGPVNDWWYNVNLSDGTTGFVWGGPDGMYVEEFE